MKTTQAQHEARQRVLDASAIMLAESPEGQRVLAAVLIIAAGLKAAPSVEWADAALDLLELVTSPNWRHAQALAARHIQHGPAAAGAGVAVIDSRAPN